MKRPMCVIGLTLALTMLAASPFSATETLFLSGAAATLALLVTAPRKRSLRIAGLVCMTAAAGFAIHSAYSLRNIAPFERAAGETVAVQGYITEAARGRRAIFYTLDARFPGRPDLPGTALALRTFGEMEYSAGEVIGCDVILDEEVAAPGDYTFAQGGFASGQAVGGITRLRGGYPVQRLLDGFRARMEANLYSALPEESAGLVAVMVLDLGESVDSATYSALNRAGTSHMLSVSGLHLSILTAALLRLFKKLRVRRQWASLAAMAAAALFAGVAGFSPSMTRAFLMTAITLAARIGHRRGDSLSSLGFAMAVICVVRPEWVLGRGLWYSALATLGILLLSPRLEAIFLRRLSKERKALTAAGDFFLSAAAVSIAAYLFTLPLTILFSGWISVVSPLANVLIAPFEIPVIAGGILLALFGGGGLLLDGLALLTNFCLAAILRVSETIGNLPFATIPIDEGWMLLWLGMLAAAVCLLVRFRADHRLAGYGALLAVLVFAAGSLGEIAVSRNRVQLAVLADCGAAVLLRGGEAVILGTPAANEANRLLRYLEFRGVRVIRAVVATDSGEQVTSGLLRLGERYAVECVIAPDDAYITDQLARAMPGIPVYPGGGLEAEFLGGVLLKTVGTEGAVRLTTAEGSVLKSPEEYVILKSPPPDPIQLYAGGAVLLQAAPGCTPSPLGSFLFGEQRFDLRVENMEW